MISDIHILTNIFYLHIHAHKQCIHYKNAQRINMSSKLVWEELKYSVPKIKYSLKTLARQQRLRQREMKRQRQRENGGMER